MTVNGIARPLAAPLDLPVLERLASLSETALQATLRRLHDDGVAAVSIEGDPEMIALAFDLGVVDRVVCWIEPAMALSADALVTAGLGAAMVGEGHRLTDLSCALEGDLVRIEGCLSAS